MYREAVLVQPCPGTACVVVQGDFLPLWGWQDAAQFVEKEPEAQRGDRICPKPPHEEGEWGPAPFPKKW